MQQCCQDTPMFKDGTYCMQHISQYFTSRKIDRSVLPILATLDHWKNDSETNGCTSCDISFGMFVRKHHCRSCGDIFCADCAPEFEVFAGTRFCEACVTACMDSLDVNTDTNIGNIIQSKYNQVRRKTIEEVHTTREMIMNRLLTENQKKLSKTLINDVNKIFYNSEHTLTNILLKHQNQLKVIAAQHNGKHDKQRLTDIVQKMIKHEADIIEKDEQNAFELLKSERLQFKREKEHFISKINMLETIIDQQEQPSFASSMSSWDDSWDPLPVSVLDKKVECALHEKIHARKESNVDKTTVVPIHDDNNNNNTVEKENSVVYKTELRMPFSPKNHNIKQQTTASNTGSVKRKQHDTDLKASVIKSPGSERKYRKRRAKTELSSVLITGLR